MSRPRVAAAGFQHETNTFSPVPTRLADFERGGAWPALVRGEDVPPRMAGLNLPMAGFLAAADDLDVVPVLWAATEPSGWVDEDAFEAIVGQIVEGIAAAGPLDGVYLDLHGAMATPAHPDAEAEIVWRVREAVGPDLPVVASLDLHANLSADFARRVTAVTIYRTYPHVDLAATGERAGRLLRGAIADGPPAKAFRQGPFLVPITEQSTTVEPARTLYGALADVAREAGALSVDLALGFPPADVPACGPSIFAYARREQAAARAADLMLARLLAAEGGFRDPLLAADAAAREAMRLSAAGGGPVVIADPQDNPGAGGTGDTTGVLSALLAAGARDAALSAFWDPQAASAAHAAGAGAVLEIALGGAQPEVSPALPVRARVEALSDGRFAFTGPMFGGATADLGPMARLAIEHPEAAVEVIVASRRAQNADLEMFRVLGVEPARKRILAVKSAIHFLAAYRPIAGAVLHAEAPGANPCRLETIGYTRLRPGVRVRGSDRPLAGA